MATLKRLKPCNCPGCPNITEQRYCVIHKHMNDKDRPSAYKRGYDSRWAVASKDWLKDHPYCVDCNEPAVLVDHDPAHKGDMVSFWDKQTWKSRCDRCHRIKSIKEDGTLNRNKEKKETIKKEYRLS